MNHAPLHLPPAAEFGRGVEYRTRTFKSGAGADLYITTGVFVEGASDATREHLRGCGTLFLDFDVRDLLLSEEPSYSTLPRKEKAARSKALKEALWKVSQAELDSMLSKLWDRIWRTIAEMGLPQPSRIVCSGYGFHVYFWLRPGESTDIARVSAMQVALITAVNAFAGFGFADKQPVDSGTRVMRAVPSQNTKGIPRAVRLFYQSDVRTPLATFETLLPRFQAAKVESGASAANRPPEPPATKKAQGPHKVFEAIRSNPQKAMRGLQQMFDRCPFIKWAVQNPTSLSLESWRAVGQNIATVAGTHGFDTWDKFSRLDPDRYDAKEVSYQWSKALESAEQYGPITYEYIANVVGDWPGSAKQPVKSPAMLGVNFADAPDISGVPDVRTDKNGFIRPTLGNCQKLIRQHPIFGNLRTNLMGNSIELNGQTIDNNVFGAIAEVLEDEYACPFPITTVTNAVTKIAAENAYHPAEDYLLSLSGKWDGLSRVNWILASLGADINALTQTYLIVFLVGAVARALCTDPDGVKFDYVLTLQGDTGQRKSAFLAALAGQSMFTDTDIDPRDKDGKLGASVAWIRELAEIDKLFQRYGGEASIKGWITSQVDYVRPPYGRVFEKFPRRGVFVATANAREFLSDETGSRRYMVLRVRKRIDTRQIEAQRDQIWAEAVARYQAGEKWWIEGALEQAQSEDNTAYLTGQPWENIIARWCATNSIRAVSIERILVECIGKEPGSWTPNGTEARAISSILQTNHYRKERYQRAGRRVTLYIHSDATDDDIARAVAYAL